MKEENKDINPIDDLFKQALEGFSPPPPPGAWRKIKRQLAIERGSSRWPRYTAYALIVLVTTGLFFTGIQVFNHYFSAPAITGIKSVTPVESSDAPFATQQNAPAASTLNSSPTAAETSLTQPIGQNKSNTVTDPSEDSKALPVSAASHARLPSTKEKNLINQGKNLVKSEEKQTTKENQKGIDPASQISANTLENSTNTKDYEKQLPTPSTHVVENKSGEADWASSGLNSPQIADTVQTTSTPKAVDLVNPNVSKVQVADKTASSQRKTPGKQPGGKSYSLTLLGGGGNLICKDNPKQPFGSGLATAGMQFNSKGTGLEAGLGINRYTDEGKFRYDYFSFDTTGYASSSYFIEEDSSYLFLYEPIVERVDGILRVNSATHYSSLIVPVFLTQQIWNFKQFKIGVKTGPVLGFETSRKVPVPSFTVQGVELEKMTDESYTRLHFTLQMLLATRFSWQFSEHFAILLEPTALWYPMNLYSKSNRPDAQVFGYGGWIGIQYLFTK